MRSRPTTTSSAPCDSGWAPAGRGPGAVAATQAVTAIAATVTARPGGRRWRATAWGPAVMDRRASSDGGGAGARRPAPTGYEAVAAPARLRGYAVVTFARPAVTGAVAAAVFAPE